VAAVLVAEGAAPPNGEEGVSTDDNGSGGKDNCGGGGSGKDKGDDNNNNHTGASIVEGICGVDHGRTEIMNNFLHVWSLVVSIPHIVVSDRVFSRVQRN
jgi:hypothetical protein